MTAERKVETLFFLRASKQAESDRRAAGGNAATGNGREQHGLDRRARPAGEPARAAGKERDGTSRIALPRSLPEQIAEEVGRAIVAGHYEPGQRLIETELAERFGVSRGPVRESLRILERRRLVDLVPRRGAYVRKFSLQSVSDLFNVRIAITSMSIRLMPDPASNAFVETVGRRVVELEALAASNSADPLAFALTMTRAVFGLVRAAGNELAEELMTDLANQTVWTTIWRHALDYTTAERRRETAADMTAVLSAIRSGDLSAAEVKMRDLLEENRDRAVAELSRIRGEIVALHGV